MPFGRDSHCSEADLSAYLDAHLANAAKERCAAHLRACGECRDAFESLSAVRSSLRELPRASAPRSFRLRQSQVDRAPALRRPLLLQAMPLLSGVSVLSLAVFIGLVSVNVSGGANSGDSSSLKSSSGSYETSVQDDAAASENAPAAPNALSLGTSATSGTPQPEAATARNSEFFAADQAAGAAEATRAASRPPVPVAVSSDNGRGSDGDSVMHIAEAVAAAIALGSGGLAFAAYRRTR